MVWKFPRRKVGQPYFTLGTRGCPPPGGAGSITTAATHEQSTEQRRTGTDHRLSATAHHGGCRRHSPKIQARTQPEREYECRLGAINHPGLAFDSFESHLLS